ncbi:hypothetical protein ACN28S_26295 [Cystobacter fuscus]
MTSQGHRLILDAGTGIRALGEVMMREGAPRKATLFFSHLHWDHVQGFPFFSPGYLPTTELELYGPGPDGDSALASVLAGRWSRPTFPCPCPPCARAWRSARRCTAARWRWAPSA